MVRSARRGQIEPEVTTELIDQIRDAAAPLRDSRDLDPLMERIGDARFVLLGEASHGTAKYYTWRAEISRRLIVEKGFQFIAVEGDWPSCNRLDRFIKGQGDADADDALQGFNRSWDDLLHRSVEEDKLLLLDGNGPLRDRRGQRAIGVVYHPENEHLGNYVPSVLSLRYDALLFIDESHALHPLPVAIDIHEEIPETYPSGR